VPSGTSERVPSGTEGACHREPPATFSDGNSVACEPPNLDSNQEESNQEESNESVVGDGAPQCKTGSGAR
jgi:hypothetical protein